MALLKDDRSRSNRNASSAARQRGRRAVIGAVVEACEGRQLLSATAHADLAQSSLVVTTLVDEDNGTSDPSVGAGTSLREAINYANTLSGAPTITFASSLTAAGPATINLSIDGDDTYGPSALTVSGNVAIQGPAGANGIRIANADPAQTLRLFSVVSGAELTLNDLTLTGGATDGHGGAAIRNFGSTTLNRVTIANNTASNADGGGVFNGGTLTASACTFSANTTDSAGGAVCNNGSAVVTDSTFAGNSADFGGAFYEADGANALVADSTVSTNIGYHGGGFSAPLVDPANDPALITLNNDIVAGNVVSSSQSVWPDIYGYYTLASGGNLIGDVGTYPYFNSSTNMVGGLGKPTINAELTTLGDHGGATQTFGLLASSPAIDAGINSLAVDGAGHAITSDQVGAARIQNGTVDIGAVETTPIVTAAPTTTAITASHSAPTYGQAQTYAVTVSSSAATPTGSVQFYLDASAMGSPVALAGGKASTVGAANLPAGAHGVYATFIPSGAFAASSSSTLSFSVARAALKATANAQTKVFGSVDPALTYSVSGLVAGDSAAKVFTGLLTRTAGENVSSSPYAIHQGTLAADGNYTLTFVGSSLTITKDSTTSLLTSAVSGTSVIYTVAVTANAPGSGTPGGTVQFLVNGVVYHTATLSSGKATYKTSTSSIGSKTVTVKYLGSSNFSASAGALGVGSKKPVSLILK